MHKSATKCNETIGKWCKNKHGASKIIDTFETYQPIVKDTIHKLFHDFYNHQSDTASINHAHIILLPKSEAACTPDAFRPISLQNCHIKAIAKVITSGLKPYIPLLVHADQSGFISG
jgi:hypothetical protein